MSKEMLNDIIVGVILLLIAFIGNVILKEIRRRFEL